MMKMSEIAAKAKALNIKSFGMKRDEIIRSVQRAEGNFDCFGSATSYCDQEDCCFRALCLEGSTGGNGHKQPAKTRKQ